MSRTGTAPGLPLVNPGEAQTTVQPLFFSSVTGRRENPQGLAPPKGCHTWNKGTTNTFSISSNDLQS